MIIRLFLILPFLFLSCGNTKRMERNIYTEKALKKNEGIGTFKEILSENSYDSKDRLLYFLDNGIVNLYYNQTKESFRFLEKADLLQEDLYTSSITQNIAKNIINDNQVDYVAEDYESLYLNIFKSLSLYSEGREESAKVELRRGLNKLNLFQTRYSQEQDELRKLREKNKLGDVQDKSGSNIGKFNFSESVLLRLINIVSNRNENRLDEVEIDKKAIKKIWENYNSLYDFKDKLDLEKDIITENSKKEILDIFAFSGLVAYKTEIALYVYHANDFLIVSTSSSSKIGDFLFFPFKSEDPIGSFNIAIPIIEKRKTNEIQSVKVYIDNKETKNLKLVENISNIAENQYENKKISVITRALIRSLGKAIALNLLRKNAKKEGGIGIYSILSIAGDISSAALESADIRGWNTLPDNCYFGEILLEKNKKYNIEVKYFDNYDNFVKSTFHEVNLNERRKENVLISYGL